MNLLVCTPGRLLQHFDETVGFDASNLQVLVDSLDAELEPGLPLQALVKVRVWVRVCVRVGVGIRVRARVRSRVEVRVRVRARGRGMGW